MKRILVLCPYPKDVAPSQRLKFEQYYESFREAGYEVVVSPFISYKFWKIIYRRGELLHKVFYTITGYGRRIADLFSIWSYDVIYVHLWVTPLGPPLFERMVRLFAKKIIFDIDDLVYLKDIKSKANPLISKLKGAQKPLYMMRVSDHVITCTPYLDSFVRKLNPRTTDISSTVDTDRYKPRQDYKIREEKVVLGWSGSLSTSKYLHLLDNVFKTLKRKVDFKLLVIGDKDFKMDGIDVEAHAWSKEIELPTISRFDIGLYPLPDEEWVYGKSGLKAIQYMAMGIPTVATAIGTNFRVIENNYDGFLVNNETEWVECLDSLIKDEGIRKRIGLKSAVTVEQKFSIRANKDKYLSIIREVAS
jgi:glycosyltransferase involved in cell wall biosynthesis